MMTFISRLIVTGSLLIAGSALVAAQTLTQSSAGGSRPTTAAKKPTKPAAPAQRAAATAPAYDGSEPGRLSDYWTIERALPGRTSERVTRAREADVVPAIRPIPLENGAGNLSVASGNIRSSQLYDGTPVPGITQNSYNNSSYVGLSISSSNDSKTFPMLAPPAARWNGSNGW